MHTCTPMYIDNVHAYTDKFLKIRQIVKGGATYMHAYMHTCIHTYMRMHDRMYTAMCLRSIYVRKYLHACIHICMYLHCTHM